MDYGKPQDPAYGAPPPPPPAYSTTFAGGAPPPPPGTVVYTQQPGTTVVLAPQHFRESPVRMRCPHCQAEITTTTVYQSGTMTWISAGVICLVGCWLGCCLIPFCVSAAKDVIHMCPSCHQQVGRFDRLS